MKVIAVLEDDIAAGGAFNQALNAILQMQRVCKGRFDFEVLASSASGRSHLGDLGIDAAPFSPSLFDKLFLRLGAYPWWRHLQRRLRLVSAFERQLLKRGCDLVYFVRQSELSGLLQRLNFIATLFDLCHRDTPEFPEVREFGEFWTRERYFSTHLTGATLILADSAALAAAAAHRYGVDGERLLVMPFAPAAFLDARAANDKPTVLRKYALAEGYLFYPAQFWAHKNHVRILEALVILRERGQHPRVVFSGGDKGNLRHVTSFVGKRALGEQVRFLGFVPAEDVRGLYEGCSAVVMPTYFGPTNLPPLEAWMVGRPLIYSSRCAEQAGDAALCVDPDDAEELARAMQQSMDPGTSANLVRLGALRLKQIAQQRADAEAELLRRLRLFEARRRCWE
jgi:glycosyltransferase involved in cell wall biosynthesis